MSRVPARPAAKPAGRRVRMLALGGLLPVLPAGCGGGVSARDYAADLPKLLQQDAR
ncbi:hypothetical protein AB0L00_42160 [Actinoallomurus sp. NPDC052308]|uniref:hypothetical protein n=1 Tax=Actinoallomurus sp. NPDC052308 TaxID=3155530 RepID=UPI003447763F